jgi:hypothetical protein
LFSFVLTNPVLKIEEKNFFGLTPNGLSVRPSAYLCAPSAYLEKMRIKLNSAQLKLELGIGKINKSFTVHCFLGLINK